MRGRGTWTLFCLEPADGVSAPHRRCYLFSLPFFSFRVVVCGTGNPCTLVQAHNDSPPSALPSARCTLFPWS